MGDYSSWLVDDNSNACSIEYFGSKEAAQNALDSLVNCQYLVNCINCVNCRSCSLCVDCADCYNSHSCVSCIGLSEQLDLNNVTTKKGWE